MAEPEPTRQDLQAALAARRELGRDYEDAVIDSFMERLDRSVAARVDARLAERDSGGYRPPTGDAGATQSFVLGMVSLGTGIPITAIATSNGGVLATVVAWAGIVGVNVAHAVSRRRRG